MPIPSTADEFLELASRSGLLDAGQSQAYAHGALPGGPRALANVLVRDGLLTRFQAEQLLRGKWRDFVLGGKYRVLAPLGAGGMGQVYLCEHRVMRRRVAVKVLPDRSGDPVVLERFRREARAVAQLNHPNIVGGHDIDRDGRLHFLVMEYIDGSTLHAIVRKQGPLPALRAAHYVRQTALGLQHAHEAGLVHRDVKPSNLLLERTGTVKVLDLGLARFFRDDPDGPGQRHAESLVGTMDYIAPEQALDSERADIRADVYSLGATFYFLLAGQPPSRGGAPGQGVVVPPFGRARPIRDLRPEVPEGLAAVIERMMAPEPADRYPTPAEVAEALVPWTQTPIPPPPPQEMPDLLAPVPGHGEAESPATPPWEVVSAPAGGEAETAASSGERTLTAPPWDVTVDPRAAPVLVGGIGVEATVPPESPPPPKDTNDAPRQQPAAGRGGRRRLLTAAAALLLVGGGVAAFTLHKAMTPPVRPGPAGGVAGTDETKRLVADADASARLKLLVPTYVYPAGEGLAQWERIIASPAAASVVVIANPNSGPGRRPDDNYDRVLARARRQGVTVIGYVSTKYGRRPLDEVKGDVGLWVHLYPGIQGIFFDEQASAADKLPYYANLYEYVRKERGLSLVVTNPGTECAEEYLGRRASDVACMVEAPKGLSTYRRPPWTEGYARCRFAALLCNVGTAEQMKKIVSQMRDYRIGYCFITDAEEPNPWGRLPRYWEAEVEAVEQSNTR